ncbi:MAG: hypothetical protein AB1466_04505 [Actinomycetota bacterium]
MLMRKSHFIAILIAIFQVLSVPAFAWGPVTHYHINRYSASDFDYPEIYYFNGTGPDMFNMGDPPVKKEDGKDYDWADFVHSPDPKEDYTKSQNFAYLMLKVAGLDTNISSKDKAYGFGWGGHISADWVAHNENLFPICPRGSKGEKLHALGEALYELYVFETRGPIVPWEGDFPFTLRMKFNPDLIYKAMVNYRMIDVHEEKPALSDQEIKEVAFRTTLPKWYIKDRCRKWVGSIAAMQAAYAGALAAMGPLGKQLFLEKMRDKGAEENIALSEDAVYAWANNPIARNHIPDYGEVVTPFYPFKLVHLPVSFRFAANSLLFGFAPRFAWAEGGSLNAAEAKANPDEITCAFWEGVAFQAEQEGILQTEEQISLNEGEEDYIITATITDGEKFDEILKYVIWQHIQNPSSDNERKFAIFWKNLYIEGISDPDLLTDSMSPTITGLTPEDGGYTPWHKPVIFATVEDDPLGIGIDEDSIRMEVDGIKVGHTYIPELNLVLYTPEEYLSRGEHEVTIKVSDKAGNETKASWNFTIKTLFSHVLFSDRDMGITGNPKIIGNIHSNGDAVVSGSPEVQGNITAVGSIIINGKQNIHGELRDHAEPRDFPLVDFEYYEYLAKFHGTHINGDIDLREPQGMIFVDGDVKLSGRNTNTATIISTGAIEISGDLHLQPDVDGLILIAKGDIKSSGKGGITGVIYSSRRVKISGEKEYIGAITAQNLEVSGKPLIRYDSNLSH